MKKAFFVLAGAIILSMTPVLSASAITVNINENILNRANIRDDTDWTVIDGSDYSPWESGIRSIYVAMMTTMTSLCVGNDVSIFLRPFNDNKNVRMQFLTSIQNSPIN